jgi:hypothetical protein
MSDSVNIDFLKFIRDGKFVDLNALKPIFGEDKLKEANTPMLESFGCATESLIDEGFAFLMSVSLDKTFNSWSNDTDGTSGISGRKLVDAASTPGAVLTMVGLLRSHPDAKASGELTISYNNPQRGLRR